MTAFCPGLTWQNVERARSTVPASADFIRPASS